MNLDSDIRKKPQKLRVRLKAATEDGILKAAEQVFAREGVHGARMESIAAEAGVAVGTLYNYFRDRHALLEALRTAHTKELWTNIDAVLALPRLKFEVRLHRFFDALVELFFKHDQLWTLLLEEEPDLGRAHSAMQGKRTRIKALAERTDRLLAIGLKAGILRKQDAPYLTAVLMGIVRGLLILPITGAVRAPRPDADTLVRLFLQGAGASGRRNGTTA